MATLDDFGYDIISGFRMAAEPAGFQVEIVPLTIALHLSRLLGKSVFYALSCQLNGVPLRIHLLHGELVCRDSCGPVRTEAASIAKNK